MSDKHRSLSAIMITDIKDFSVLNQKNEELALELLDEHNALIRSVIPQHGGLEIKTIGDAFLVEFRSALNAVRCATEVQRTLHERNSSATPERAILVRIGIHVGDVVHRENDVFGDGVNIAARIEPHAPPGGICISDQVYAQVHNKMQENILSIGRPKLKNIDFPIELYWIDLPWTESSAKQKPAKPAACETRSIIALPFHDLSPDKEREYIGEGITEELINGLSRIEDLRVIARTTAFSFKGKNVDIRELADSLKVQFVIDGSIKIHGDKLRLNVQFSTTAEGSSIFSSKYDRKLEDIFDLQDEIALSIIDTLKLKILKTEKPVDVHTENTEAYMLYLQGRSFWNTRSTYGLEKALEFFKKSLVLDENNPLPHIGLADTYNLLTDDAGWDMGKTYPPAREHACKALEMDDSISEAHATMGYIHTLREWDYTLADRHFKKAVELNPNYVYAHLWYAFYHGATGNYEKALRECQKAYELDPLSIAVVCDLGLFHALNENFDAALSWCDRALEMSPGFWLAEYFKSVTCIKMQDWRRTIEISEKQQNVGSVPSYFYGNLGVAYALLGKRSRAEEILATLKEKGHELHVLSYDKGVIHMALGDLEAAFDDFETSVTQKDLRLNYLSFFFGYITDFIEHRRFKEVMNMINLDPPPHSE